MSSVKSYCFVINPKDFQFYFIIVLVKKIGDSEKSNFLIYVNLNSRGDFLGKKWNKVFNVLIYLWYLFSFYYNI
jgi:hypothetical protein